MNISFLHLSDLHISNKSIKDIRIVRNVLFKDLSTFKSKLNITPNLIFFSGDMINKGQNAKEEFALFDTEFIKPLLEHISLSSDYLFIVPGNHEIDRERTSEVFENGLQTKLNTGQDFIEYYRELNSNKIDLPALKYKLNGLNKYLLKVSNKNLVADTFFYRAFIVKVKELSVGILCLNSTWLSSQFGDDRHKLIIGEDVFTDALKFIEHTDIKIAQAHHPFEMLKDWDSKSLKNLLSRNIDIFLNGHIHDSEFEYSQQIYGRLYVSTCASLYSGRIRNGYSFIDIDLSKKELNIYLRKYYEKRGEFDQETDKCVGGLITYKDFKCSNERADYIINLNHIKSKMEDNQFFLPISIVHPFDGLTNIKLNDVFVDPIISDVSPFENPVSPGNQINLEHIIKENQNCIFFGRKEFGKTTLLKFIFDKILCDHKYFESKIPVFLNFNDLPKNNYKSVISLIRKQFSGVCEKEQIEEFISNGDMIFIIDDFDDYNATDREDKKNIFYLLLKNFPHCRFILSINEIFAQRYTGYTMEPSKLSSFKSYFLASLNTSRIRQILEKWRPYNSFDTEMVLRQIVFYFQQLKIPITPITVTLLMGVLIRDSAEKNINNEAYLIENYLESLLEKLDKVDYKQPLDFREKESFLAFIAYRMYELNKYELDKNEFEREKLDYFISFDEDVPDEKVFQVFFSKGILLNNNNQISFKFKFLFFFFLAKAFQKDRRRLNNVLQSKHFLKYSASLSYMAGLDRGDIELLRAIDNKTQDFFNSLFSQTNTKELDNLDIGEGLFKYSEDMRKEIIKKNACEEKDDLRDKKYLDYDEKEQTISSAEDEEEYDDIVQLVTLNSDIIRNTREIPTEDKHKFIRNNIIAYKNLMWQTIEVFQEIIEIIDKKSLETFLMDSRDSSDSKIKEMSIEDLVKKLKEITIQIIPVSIIMYMSEHLMNYRLKNSLKKLSSDEQDETDKLFYLLVLFKCDPSTLPLISNFIDETKSFIIDQLVYIFLIFHCGENKLGGGEIENILNLLDKIRKKHTTFSKLIPPYMKDTFRDDIKRKIEINKLKE